MNKKYILAAFIFALFAFIGLYAAVSYQKHQNAISARGHYVFEQMRSQIPLMSHIRLQNSDEEEINLYHQGDLWHFREAADYFVNNETLAAFYDFINNSTITDIQKASDEQITEFGNQSTEIHILDDNENVLAHFWLADKINPDKTRNLLMSDSKYIYTVSRARTDFGATDAWVPMPLLQIPYDDITGIDFDEQYITGQALEIARKQFDFIKDLIDALGYTLYDGIITRANFLQAYPNLKPQSIKVHLFGGLIYQLDTYAVDGSYWLSITIATERIVRTPVMKLANSLQPFYADWLFQLTDEQGKIIYAAGKKQTSQPAD
jgi:hypothetical protein